MLYLPFLLCLRLTLPLRLCSNFLPKITAWQLDMVAEWTTVTVCACEIPHRGALRQTRDAVAGRRCPTAGRNAFCEADILERHWRGDEPTVDVR